ncbi:ABC transporter permease [uncultured Sunxiuqinia sp.]|uniref:ABC transporter permease n=1 Tax=uncultured Sunxiuqinia sp. TaxID=1573825 RepID=UPI002625CD41|nr:ABC transporter permease [uncultured Sunxiuqinia sp.]
MIWRNIIVSFRNLGKNKLSGAIGITGFAAGFAVCLIIGAYVYGELTVDRQNTNYKRIYRIVDSRNDNSALDYRLSEVWAKTFAAIENACPLELQPEIQADVYSQNGSSYIKGLISTTNGFFEMFDVAFEKCLDREKPFLDQSSSIITSSLAKKLFGDQNPLGEALKVGQMETVISGVIADFSTNSSMQGEILLNSENKNFRLNSNYGNGEVFNATSHFVLLHENELKTDCESTINISIAYLNKYIKGIWLQPLSDIYLDQTVKDGNRHGSKVLIVVLSIIGFLILLLSIINYVNYLLSQQIRRLNEVGIKKANGAGTIQLLASFITDSAIWILLAAMISVMVVFVSLPMFNQLLQQQLSFSLFFSKPMVVGSLAVVLLVLLVSVIPMFFLLKKFELQHFLKRKLNIDGKQSHLNFLSVFQFSVSILLIISLVVIMNQVAYLKHKDLGFDDTNLVHVNIPFNALNYKSFKDEVLKHPAIEQASLSAGIPGNISSRMSHPDWNYTLHFLTIDRDFLSTMNIELVEGSTLSVHDQKSCLVNQATLKALECDDFRNTKVNGKNIVGVVADFNFSSLYHKIEPIILEMGDGRDLNVRIKKGGVSPAMEHIKSIWEEMTSGAPLKYEFYDTWFDSMYKKEEQLGNSVVIFALVALIITCLGLLGQISQITQYRTKEIGIRKVNGAKVTEILTMLNKDFIKWVAIAFVIACPIAWYAMSKWLENFAYKTTLSWWIFALAGFLALGIALLTVSWQSWRAATRNPVEALRYE